MPGAGPDPTGASATDEDRLRSELLAVCYRLIFAELASYVGVEVSTEEALVGVPAPIGADRPGASGPDPALTRAADRARATLRGGGLSDLADPSDLTGLGRLHEDLLAWRLVASDGRWGWHRDGRLRKAGGSYFTPSALVEHLLDEALDPFLGTGPGAGPAPALPRVLDPACGAGAFLLPAAQRLAAHARRARVAPTEARRRALAAVHGVDLDPAVLELARVVLWLGTWHDLPRHDPRRRDSEAPTAADLMVPMGLVAGDAVGELSWQQVFPDVFVDGGAEAGEFAAGEFEVGEFEAGDFAAGAVEPGGFDVVVANPPFANQLERLTARDRRGSGAGGVSAYTDLSAVFVLHALTWVRPGGRLAFVQPQSVLSARDAASVRSAVVGAGALTSLWVGESGLFDAAVPTCALVVHHGAVQGTVRRWRGGSFTRLPDRDVEAAHLRREWGFLLAAALGVPEVSLTGGRPLGELADCAADFRDQYYGLEPYVHEAVRQDAPEGAGEPTTAPLVTSGLIDPAACRWGERSTRFLKQVWKAPVVDLDAMAEDTKLAAWATRRLVPKVLLATQGKVLEAVADVEGAWLPSVPVITVRPHDPDDLWRVLAVLLAPPVCAVAATRYAGSALNPSAIKLSAKQVAGLPTPTVESAWEQGADEVRAAQETSDPEQRREVLLRAGRTLCAAYGFSLGGTTSAGPPADDLLAWWSARLP